MNKKKKKKKAGRPTGSKNKKESSTETTFPVLGGIETLLAQGERISRLLQLMLIQQGSENVTTTPKKKPQKKRK